jgi:two-component system, NtrC family, C4-dicarboxylate transport sensor histidine kinase DctB
MRSQIIKSPKGSAATTNISPHTDLVEVERLAELGRLSSSMLHEISNPITAALLYLEQYKDQPAAAMRKVQGSIRILWQYVEAARQQVRGESELCNFNVAQQMSQLKKVVMPVAKQAAVDLQFMSATDLKLYGDPVKFQQITANLIVNAIEAYAYDPTPELNKTVRVTQNISDSHVIIEVTDWGKGIKPSQLDQIFEPLYTTKAHTGHGLGIGLAIVKQYVTTDFGGSISVRSSRRQGTVFSVVLPLS